MTGFNIPTNFQEAKQDKVAKYTNSILENIHKQKLKTNPTINKDIGSIVSKLVELTDVTGLLGSDEGCYKVKDSDYIDERNGVNALMKGYHDAFNTLLLNNPEALSIAGKLAQAIEEGCIKNTTDLELSELIRETTEEVLGSHNIKWETYRKTEPQIYKNNKITKEIEQLLEKYKGPLQDTVILEMREAIRKTKKLHNNKIPDYLLKDPISSYTEILGESGSLFTGNAGHEKALIRDDIIITIANKLDELAVGMPKERADKFKRNIDFDLKSMGLERENWPSIKQANKEIDKTIKTLEKTIIYNEGNLGKLIGETNAVEFEKRMELLKQSLHHASETTGSKNYESGTKDHGTTDYTRDHWNIRGSKKKEAFTKGLEDLKNWCEKKQKEVDSPEWKKILNVISSTLQYIPFLVLYGIAREDKSAKEYQTARNNFDQSIQVLRDSKTMHTELEKISTELKSQLKSNNTINKEPSPTQQQQKEQAKKSIGLLSQR